MCGLAAIFSYRNSALLVDEVELLRIREAMLNRGPDGEGLWISNDKRVGLAHRRLAIIDLSANGAQPMATPDGVVRIIFNGEIYNFRELRLDLEAKGYRFRSNSDTEVLLFLYQEHGQDLVHHLRGMYTFVIWDERKRGILLARDPFGIKPLYYADNGTTIRIASQVKALLKGGHVDTSPEPAGHVGFFLWGYVPEPYTLYKNIRSLPAGSTMWIDASGQKKTCQFFNLTAEVAQASETQLHITHDEMLERLRAALLDSVRHHMIADVPVGVFLSAGLDSTTLVALANEVGGNDLRTVTLGFKEFGGTKDDEVPLAELVARNYGTTHRTEWVTKNDFQDEYGRVLQAMDQPSIDGVNSYFVSRAASNAGLKVALSGLGGDELFGSYPSFEQVPRMVKAFSPLNRISALGKGFRYISAPILKHFTSPKYAGLLEYGGTYGGAYLLRRGLFMPWELPTLLDGEIVRQGWEELRTAVRLEKTTLGTYNSRLKVTALESAWYMRNQLLRDADWASMAHSLEIRLPFVDVQLFRSVTRLINSSSAPKKIDLARILHLHLPDAIIRRRKTGFSIPIREWIFERVRPSSPASGLKVWAQNIYQAWGFNQNNKMRSAPTVLIFRIGQLGDTLIALPAILEIRRKYPNHRLVLLTDRHSGKTGHVSSWDVLGPTGWFDRVIYYEHDTKRERKLKLFFTLLRELRSLNVEHVFNLASRSERQAIRDRLFFRIVTRAQSYHPLAVPLSRTEREWSYLLRSVGVQKSQDYEFRLTIPELERETALRVVRAEFPALGKRLLAIGPGSKMPSKRWPLSRYAELGRRLLSDFSDVQLLVLGGDEDILVGDELCKIWGNRSHNLAGKLSVYGSAAILEHCTAYVGNDTGTMHLGAMVGKPCVALFSARDALGKWEPFGNAHVVLRHEVECAGCMLENCTRDNKCLNLISVDEVYIATRAIVMRNKHLALAGGV